MNYSCQEEYNYYMNAQAEYEQECQAMEEDKKIAEAIEILKSLNITPERYRKLWESMEVNL